MISDFGSQISDRRREARAAADIRNLKSEIGKANDAS